MTQSLIGDSIDQTQADTFPDKQSVYMQGSKLLMRNPLKQLSVQEMVESTNKQ